MITNNNSHKRLFNDYLERQKTLKVLEQKFLLNESQKYPFSPIINQNLPNFHKIHPSLVETEGNKNKNHNRPKTKSFFSYTAIRKNETIKNRKIKKIEQNNIYLNPNFMSTKTSTNKNLYNDENDNYINKQKTYKNLEQNNHNKEISMDLLKKYNPPKKNPQNLANNIYFQQSKIITNIPINSEYRINASRKKIIINCNSGKVIKQAKKCNSQREKKNFNNNQYSSILNVERANSSYFTNGYVHTESNYHENNNSSKITLTNNNSIIPKISLNSSNFDNCYKNNINATSSRKIIITSNSSENYYNNNSYKYINKNHLTNNSSTFCFKMPKNDFSDKLFEKNYPYPLNQCICGMSKLGDNTKIKNNCNCNMDNSSSTNYMDKMSQHDNQNSTYNYSNNSPNKYNNYNKNLSKNIIIIPCKNKNMNNLRKNNHSNYNSYKITNFEMEFNSKNNSLNKKNKNDNNKIILKKKEFNHNYRKINGQVKQNKESNKDQFSNKIFIEKNNDFKLIQNETKNSNKNKFNDLCVAIKEVNGNINPINCSNGGDNLRLSQNSQMTTQSISDSKILEIANFYLAKDENVDKNIINGILALKNKEINISFK